MNTSPVPVYMSCDDNYAIHLCVVIASIIANTKSRVHFVIFVSKLSNQNKACITKVCGEHLVDFIESDEMLAELSGVSSGHSHISMSACSRYFIPKLDLPYEKGIYLDCDVLVLGDIKELYDINILGSFSFKGTTILASTRVPS